MIHTRIAGHSLASTTSAAQNFHTNVIFNAEFNGGVQICNSLCAYIIKIWKNWKPGKTSRKFPIWHLIYQNDFFQEKSNLQYTVKHSKLQFLTVWALPQKNWSFFSTNTIQDICIKYLSVGFWIFFMK